MECRGRCRRPLPANFFDAKIRFDSSKKTVRQSFETQTDAVRLPAVTAASTTRESNRTLIFRTITAGIPTAREVSLITGSGLLTVLPFPNFNLWFLAWVSLSPLLVVVTRAKSPARGFVAGWLWATVFFFGTCWWLTYPMIHYARIRMW